MDGTIRDVQHLIMLSILAAQSADESASFAPGDRHRLHGATVPQPRRLAPEEPPPLAVRPSASLASVLHGPGSLPEGWKALRVGPGELHQPEARDEGDRPLEVSGIAVLDDLLELASQGRRQLHRPRERRARGSHERSHRVRAGREPVVSLEAVEKRLLFRSEAHSEKASRGSVGSSVPHAFNTNLTHIYELCLIV